MWIWKLSQINLWVIVPLCIEIGATIDFQVYFGFVWFAVILLIYGSHLWFSSLFCFICSCFIFLLELSFFLLLLLHFVCYEKRFHVPSLFWIPKLYKKIGPNILCLWYEWPNLIKCLNRTLTFSRCWVIVSISARYWQYFWNRATLCYSFVM